MKKTWIVIAVVAVVVISLFGWVKGMYNGMVEQEETVNKAWSQVENVYQRRADLIPNLVNTVKGYAAHESETLQGVVEARAKATQMTVNVDDLTEENIKKYQAAQGDLQQAIGRLLMLTENYPDLKANENFRDLQAQLEGTENRITVERQKFNEAAKEYNTNIRKFPTNIFAGMFGFEKKGYFEAQAGAEKAPEVKF
ncbi:MAG: LemA family protein [Muribaculaceae bacterium]|nr:LemA family protein [Muribaculaceae bacterium]